jgi:hypothetical protein
MATSIIPPFAAFFMKALFFALGGFGAMARPAKLNETTARARIPKREVVIILLFIADSPLRHIAYFPTF